MLRSVMHYLSFKLDLVEIPIWHNKFILWKVILFELLTYVLQWSHSLVTDVQTTFSTVETIEQWTESLSPHYSHANMCRYDPHWLKNDRNDFMINNFIHLKHINNWIHINNVSLYNFSLYPVDWNTWHQCLAKISSMRSFWFNDQLDYNNLLSSDSVLLSYELVDNGVWSNHIPMTIHLQTFSYWNVLRNSE